MGADDDIAASLPRPPRPAPARRETAIAAALRRFDGVGEASPAPAPRGPAAPAQSWFGRPHFGALAGAALVALIALPLAWTSLDEQPYREAREPAPSRSEPAAESAMPAPALPAASEDAVPAEPEAALDEAPAATRIDAPKPAPEPVPAAEPAAEPAADRQEGPPLSPDATGDAELVVTGSRIRRPNLESATPVTVVDAPLVVTGARAAAARASRPARRGDWNACTVDDPVRNLAACRVPAPVSGGLERAWKGDWDGALQAFDSAVAAAPRSSQAYLNRALVHRRRGDLDRALADLDRAVRFSPRAARFHYQRSLLLRQIGDARRARADEARAVELDPRYSAVVAPDGKR
jgi:hypothetical protein